MKFTKELAAISLAYRTKYKINLHPEFAFFDPFTDEMEATLARAFELCQRNESQYRAACHQIIEDEREFLRNASDEDFAEVYGPSPYAIAMAFTSASLRREQEQLEAIRRSPILMADLIDQIGEGIMARSGYGINDYRSINQ